jgi:hypothetical protein
MLCNYNCVWLVASLLYGEALCALYPGVKASKRCLERVFPNLIDMSAHRRYVFFHMLEKSSKFTWKVCYRCLHMVCLFPNMDMSVSIC